MDTELSPEEVTKALQEAEAKGLPPGWTVKLDKRRRRKWIAPNGKSCDSIPKAIAISVEIGLLPPDTIIPVSNKKRQAGEEHSDTPVAKKQTKTPSKSPVVVNSSSSFVLSTPKSNDYVKDVVKQSSSQKVEIITPIDDVESDPEDSLRPTSSTVHYDPTMGKLVGWRIRIWDTKAWRDGRIILYDSYTNKHKVRMKDKMQGLDTELCIWLRLIHETVQYAVRLVWAHVKGFAWWPAMVMDGDALDGVSQKKGQVLVNFFVTNEVSSLKDSLESIRPFNGGKVDDVISKHKKKRNDNAIKTAREEASMIIMSRNQAFRYYATKAFEVVNHRCNFMLGRRVELHRPDVHYPYGDTVVGTIRQFNCATKKCLLSFEPSIKTKVKYPSTWMNLKEYNSLKILDKRKSEGPSDYDLIPFLYWFKSEDLQDDTNQIDEQSFSITLKGHCNACVDTLSPGQTTISCSKCTATFHLGCVEPDNLPSKNSNQWTCSRCITCSGCWQHDIAFGCHSYTFSNSKTYSLDSNGLYLCAHCTHLYDKKQFCPNCYHSWDDHRYQRVHSRVYTSPFMKNGNSRGGRKRKNSDDDVEEIEMEPSIPIEADWYHPDTFVWGYTAGNMLGCDSCGLWVHAGCSGLSREDYDRTSSGKHPIYSNEFLCRSCCKKRCYDLIDALKNEDKLQMFALPVTEDVAPMYLDIIKKPMDLQTMSKKVHEGSYKNYAWLREDFELMVLNALTFNSFHSKFWSEAKRYYSQAIEKIFNGLGRGAPPGMYKGLVDECFRLAEKERKMEEQRVQQDETTEKKDLVAGARVTSITLPPLKNPSDLSSCIPFTEIKLKHVDAHYFSWMDTCFTCGSSGASDTMLFCVDCGEAFHPFCVNAPIHSMDKSGVSGWRCPNCKICEISCEVPHDELKMLYCEMCDRAFTLDLLDPPLKAAPEGLWICGQCVNCAVCKNNSEKKGASIKYWSRDPLKCYRCGGCKGLVEEHTKKMHCSVCDGICRKHDDDILLCSKCKLFTHIDCDAAASKATSDDIPEVQVKFENYECLRCRGHRKPDIECGINLRKQLQNQALSAITSGLLTFESDDGMKPEELHAQLCNEIDWKIREMWQDEYLSVIEDGFTMITAIKRRNLDPRVMIRNSLAGLTELPTWMSQRAARFLLLASKGVWEMKKVEEKRIYFIQVLARMAAAYLRVNCRAFQLQESIEVRSHSRMLLLLNEPNNCGMVHIPTDPLRVDAVPIPQFESDSEIKTETTQSLEDGTLSKLLKKSTADVVDYIIAEPVCGWNEYLDPVDNQYEWKDPRVCCLCRTCGDDDGDNERQVIDGKMIARCGRLLPMKDGFWVHASCALWSSEVYEAPKNNLVHAVEKARSRGSQLKCFGCGRPGATVGCCKPNCSRNYHFPCAKACGAVFTTEQQMFCEAHRSSAVDELPTESVEHMKSLLVADDRKETIDIENKSCFRVGGLTIHSLGEIEQENDGFHSEKYITPPGFLATRIFWSFQVPRKRTVYVLRIEKDKNSLPVFSIVPGDNPSSAIRERNAQDAYNKLIQLYMQTNRDYFSAGKVYSRLPAKRKNYKKAFGLNGPQFFGFGLNSVRRALELSPGIEAVVAPLSGGSPSYRFAYYQPDLQSIMDLQRNRAAVAAENALENASGCARAEGMKAVAQSGGSGRITRALVRSAEQEDVCVDAVATGRSAVDGDEKKAKADRDSNVQKYKNMKSVQLDERLAARRSHIHGWGLFCKIDLPKDSMIVEYMGEVVHQSIADKREKGYEQSGIGSCYMFRLDLQRIVDATTIGCMARFMNHCCRPNAYAKVISVDTQGFEKKIVIFANRDISAGEEITYDYKFPVEDGSLRCTCGAPNCIGRMN